MCAEHHRAFDQGRQAQRMVLKSLARDYLKAHYPSWREENLIYRKE
jgi:hypothetical protein